MYAGTWSGLFKSIDGGRTWLRLRFRVGLSYLESVSDLELAQRTPATVFAAVDGEVLKSTDGGAHWRWLRSVPIGVDAVAVDPQRPTTLYAGGGNVAPGLAKSTDGGMTWKVLEGERRPKFAVTEILVDPSNPVTVYVALKRGQLVKTTDGGGTWRPAGDGFGDAPTLAFDPRSSTTIYAGSSAGAFRSTDGARSWESLGDDLNGLDIAALTFSTDGRILYVGTGGGGVLAYRVPGR